MIYNFSPGPAVVFKEVLLELQNQFCVYKDMGYSLMEASHRGKDYYEVHHSVMKNMLSIMGLCEETYTVLLLGGGATLQFGMIPLNFASNKKSQYIITGVWGKKALKDAQVVGNAESIYDGSTNNYTCIPHDDEFIVDTNAAYVHVTTNETIGGVQWQHIPTITDVPLIADMSSDILSRSIDYNKFSLIYAGAQKNIGVAGVTVVIIRKSMLEHRDVHLPMYLNYKTHIERESLYNTPPVFSIWVLDLVLQHLQDMGGVSAMEAINVKKTAMLYSAIDKSEGFYMCPVHKECRSKMNVVFTLPNEDLEKQFLKEATDKGFVGLKGHRSVGGCRASIYNAMSQEGVEALTSFMDSFHFKKG